jgi:hypothetical protein
LPLDLSDKAIAAAVSRLLDDIAQEAMTTKRAGKIHARDLGRALGLKKAGSRERKTARSQFPLKASIRANSERESS